MEKVLNIAARYCNCFRNHGGATTLCL